MILSIFEVLVAGFVLWGLFNEDKFIEFEDRIIKRFKRYRTRNGKMCKISHIDACRSNPTHCA